MFTFNIRPQNPDLSNNCSVVSSNLFLTIIKIMLLKEITAACSVSFVSFLILKVRMLKG